MTKKDHGNPLLDAGNWTPLLDGIVAEVGLVCGAVWCCIWRHENMSAGKCFASQSTIARKTGLSRRTVNKHIACLVELGYIYDRTPNRSGTPHDYNTTPRGRLVAQVAWHSDEADIAEGAPGPCDTPNGEPVNKGRKTCEATSRVGESKEHKGWELDSHKETNRKPSKKSSSTPFSEKSAENDRKSSNRETNDDFLDDYKKWEKRIEDVIKRNLKSKERQQLNDSLDNKSESYTEPEWLELGLDRTKDGNGHSLAFMLSCARNARSDALRRTEREAEKRDAETLKLAGQWRRFS